jgi:hypothetical protein
MAKQKPAPAKKAPKKAATAVVTTIASPVGKLLEERRPSPTRMPAHLAKAIAANPPQIASDKLLELREMVSAARDLEKEREMLNERLSAINSALDGPEGYFFRKLPALMSEIGMTSLTLEPEGNLPGYVATSAPYYKASISAEWPEDKRKEAFDYLEEVEAGDLIKTEVTVAFPREQRELAKKFQVVAKKYGDATIKENVAWNTLTAWLREQVEENGEMPQLDKIGGIVARIVKLKPLKD